MSTVDARDRYVETLLDKVSADRHPSPQLVDRLILSMRNRDHVEQVVDVLFDRLGWYPSPATLDRLDSVIGLLELADEVQERHEPVGGS